MITAARLRSRYFTLLMLERVALLLEWMAVIWRFLKQSLGHLNVARHASTTFPSLPFASLGDDSCFETISNPAPSPRRVID